MARRVMGVVVVVAMVVLASGCDPDSVPDDPNQISMELSISPNGDGSVRLGFGRRPSASELRDIGAGLTTSVFVDAPVTPTIDSNGAGYPFLVIRSGKVFEPGSHPQVNVDTTALCRGLLSLGYTQISISVMEPQTPHTWNLSPAGSQSSMIDDCASAPLGTLVMSPEPWLWWAGIGLVVLCLAANLVTFRLRRTRPGRHRMIVAWGLLACVPFGASIATASAARTDNLVVRGEVSGFAATLLTALTVLVFPLGLWALAQVGTELGKPNPAVAPAPSSFT